jgi:hypothetical protein
VKNLINFLFLDSQEADSRVADLDALAEKLALVDKLKSCRTPLLTALKKLDLPVTKEMILDTPDGIRINLEDSATYQLFAAKLRDPDVMSQLGELGWVANAGGEDAMTGELPRFHVDFLCVLEPDVADDEKPEDLEKLLKAAREIPDVNEALGDEFHTGMADDAKLWAGVAGKSDRKSDQPPGTADLSASIVTGLEELGDEFDFKKMYGDNYDGVAGVFADIMSPDEISSHTGITMNDDGIAFFDMDGNTIAALNHGEIMKKLGLSESAELDDELGRSVSTELQHKLVMIKDENGHPLYADTEGYLEAARQKPSWAQVCYEIDLGYDDDGMPILYLSSNLDQQEIVSLLDAEYGHDDVGEIKKVEL